MLDRDRSPVTFAERRRARLARDRVERALLGVLLLLLFAAVAWPGLRALVRERPSLVLGAAALCLALATARSYWAARVRE